MKLLSALSLLLLVLPASAQVEKIAMRTTGISCGFCAGLSEIYFRRLPGVERVKISLKNEAILLIFKPDAPFDPHAIREVLAPLKVGVTQFQIGARGAVEEHDKRRWLLAGKDKFVLLDSSPAPPLHTPVRVEGILFDQATPMEVRILTVTPLRK